MNRKFSEEKEINSQQTYKKVLKYNIVKEIQIYMIFAC